MTEHERIWLEPAGAPDRCWCQDNQWGDDGVEYVLASTLDGAHAEENRLRIIALDMQAGYREAIARAEATENALDSLCAWLLHRFGPDSPEGREASCRMSSRTALASTGGEHHADK